MSKPLTHHARPHLTVAKPAGSLIKYIFRMGLYWLCATVLLWAGPHPLAEWRLPTMGWFYVSSSLVVPVLGYASFWLHGGGASSRHPDTDKIAHPFALTINQAGVLVLELFMALMAAVAVERLLF